MKDTTDQKRKACFKCGGHLPLSSFYPHARMADGRLNKCKECTKRDVRENRVAKADKYREYDRNRHNTPEAVRARKNYERLVAPEKDRARRVLHAAVRRGRIAREGCVVCGSFAHAHHEDYSKPLNVIWLCPSHHAQRHAEIAGKSDHGVWEAIGSARPRFNAREA